MKSIPMDSARSTPDRVAIDYGGRLVTYRELDEGSDAFAASFATLQRGDCVATLTGSTPSAARTSSWTPAARS